MDFYIVIPCYNESQHIGKTLTSLCEQSLLPRKVVVVNDNSTDDSAEIVSAFAKSHTFIKLIHTTTQGQHEPGSKVIRAFQQGLKTLDEDYDILCKFDADLIFPKDYLETIASHGAATSGDYLHVETSRQRRRFTTASTPKDSHQGSTRR